MRARTLILLFLGFDLFCLVFYFLFWQDGFTETARETKRLETHSEANNLEQSSLNSESEKSKVLNTKSELKLETSSANLLELRDRDGKAYFLQMQREQYAASGQTVDKILSPEESKAKAQESIAKALGEKLKK